MSAKPFLIFLVPVAMATGLAGCLEDGSGGGARPGVVTASSAGFRGETGRVVSTREVALRGGSSSGMNDGTLLGGGVGAAGGAVVGAATTNSASGAVVGGVLGAVGGAIAGTLLGRDTAKRRGVEVTVEKDDGQPVTIAQADDGSVHTGDRVVIIYDNKGVARAVRDEGRRD